MIRFTNGDMFSVNADILINTVNCVGVMGAGVALAFKERYPSMYIEYKELCNKGLIKPGELHVWHNNDKIIVNFPTKRHWRNKSLYKDIESGLVVLNHFLKTKNKGRVALPALGCGHGGLDWNIVSKMIKDHLSEINLDIMVFEPNDSRNITKTKKTESIKHLDLEQLNISQLQTSIFFQEKQYIQGNTDLLKRNPKNIFILDHKKDNTSKATSALIKSFMNINSQGDVSAIIYRSNKDDHIIKKILKQKQSIIIILPFGMFAYNNNIVQELTAESNILFISPYSLHEEWSENKFINMLVSLSTSNFNIISSDDPPLWLKDLYNNTKNINNIYLIKYNDTLSYLSAIGIEKANLLGKQSKTGDVNLKPLYRERTQHDNDLFSLNFHELKKVIYALEQSGIEGEFEYLLKFKSDHQISKDIIKNILKTK